MIVKPSTNVNRQQYERMIKLAEVARQRYLDAGGNPKRSANDQYWTQEEKQEFLQLGRQIFSMKVSSE
jgi:hypothetical protein